MSADDQDFDVDSVTPDVVIGQEYDDGDGVDGNLKSCKIKRLFSTEFKCCPWDDFKRPGGKDLLKWKFIQKNYSSIPETEGELNRVLPVLKVDKEKLKNPPPDKIQVTWIGHATVLVQFDGITILTDPVFNDQCGPSIANALNLSYKRYRKAACQIEDLPKIDAVLISHNHFDHLEDSAVKRITRKYVDTKWFVTLEQKPFLTERGVAPRNIRELNWWHGVKVTVKGKVFDFICTPSQHWCQRQLFDKNHVLWCSWVIKGPTKSFCFLGETGYHEPLFKTIGEQYGPFDLAAIPIGAYNPRFITQFQQVDPEEAVKIHQDVKSKQSIGIHWGTFELTNEFYAEPPQLVEREMQKLDRDPNKFIALCHGQTLLVERRDRAPFMDVKGKTSKRSSETELQSPAGQQSIGGTRDLCKICMERETSTVFVDCGHMLCCTDCSKNLERCPICRAKITKWIRVYKS